MDYSIPKGVLFRFLRGYFSGAVAALTTAVALAPATNDWSALETWFGHLLFASIIGGITGGVLALDKYVRETFIK